jgi:predicted DNA-binding transcriptional regulator AlpA
MDNEILEQLAKPIGDQIARYFKDQVVIVPAKGLTAAEAIEATGIKRSKFYAMIKSGKIKTCPETPLRIPVSEIVRMNSVNAAAEESE